MPRKKGKEEIAPRPMWKGMPRRAGNIDYKCAQIVNTHKAMCSQSVAEAVGFCVVIASEKTKDF